MSAGHSTGALVFVGTAALALGAAATVVISQPESQAKLRIAKKKIAELLKSWGLEHVYTYITPAETTNGDAASSVAPSETGEEADPTAMANTRLAIVLRQDELNDAGELVCHASRTVLGHFKKLYKRRDANLKLWEGGGQRMEVRVASNDTVMVAIQQTARGAGIPTHTFAGKPGQPRQRSLMVVGPADKSKLWEIVGRLEEA